MDNSFDQKNNQDNQDGIVQRKKEAQNFDDHNQVMEQTFEAEPTQMKTDSNAALPNDVQAKMENSFDTDFSDVDIHTESQTAKNMGALAFTQGSNVHFAPGQFKPDTRQGQELIGHEFAHVVQQRQGRVEANTQVGKFPVNNNTQLEAEADVLGQKAARWDHPAQTKMGTSGFPSLNSANQPVQHKLSAKERTAQENKVKNLRNSVPDGQLMDADTFASMTYEGFFSSKGTAKKAVIDVLEHLKDVNLARVVKGNKNGLTINDLTVSQLWTLQRELIVLDGVADTWTDYKGDDPDTEEKRAIGFKEFDIHIENLLKKLPGAIKTASKKAGQNKTDEDIETEMNTKALEAGQDERLMKIKKHYANKSANSILTSFATPLEKLAPDAGKSGKLEAQVEIPLEPTGIAFIGGRISMEAERTENNFKTRMELGLVGGAKAGIFKITGELGGFLESQGKSPQEALNLISYGFYRLLKEKTWTSPFADWAWGGKSAAAKFKAAIEKEAFSQNKPGVDPAYVDLGLYAKAKLGIGAEKVVGGELEAQGTIGKRYDESTTEGKGKVAKKFAVSGKLTIAGYSTSIGYTKERVGDDIATNEVEIGIELPNVPKIADLVIMLKDNIQGVKEKIDAEEKKNNPNSKGDAVVLQGFENVKDKIEGDVKSKLESALGIKSTDNMEIGITIDFTNHAKAELTISTKTTKSLEAGVFSGSAEFKEEKFKLELN